MLKITMKKRLSIVYQRTKIIGDMELDTWLACIIKMFIVDDNIMNVQIGRRFEASR